MDRTTVNHDQNQGTGVYAGQPWLVEERDACGVGFIADQQGRVSHALIEKALTALTCLEHRGGCSADQDSGDGAGLMTALPWDLLQQWLAAEGIQVATSAQMGVGMVFLPATVEAAAIARQVMERIAVEEGLTVLGWRVVPTLPELLGKQARENLPQIEQVLVQSEQQGDALERQLYLTRRRVHNAIRAEVTVSALQTRFDDFYFCSFSSRTIVYKGMVRSAVLGDFYTDLKNPAYKSTFAVYHRRFSTNTLPRWPLAQPMRLLGHNGEINTLLGNVNWMVARDADLAHACWGDRIADLKPTVNLDNSDSANLDNVFELLVWSGRSPQEALMIMVPEAYQNQPDLVNHPEITDFYEYYSGIQEPWDGPGVARV
ncbi:MAG: hypothetical protein RBJ76_24690 [Stenomitos frigidus ULC029]